MSKKDKKKKKAKVYPKNPTQWWECESVHHWFKAEKKKLSAEAKKRFEKMKKK